MRSFVLALLLVGCDTALVEPEPTAPPDLAGRFVSEAWPMKFLHQELKFETEKYLWLAQEVDASGGIRGEMWVSYKELPPANYDFYPSGDFVSYRRFEYTSQVAPDSMVLTFPRFENPLNHDNQPCHLLTSGASSLSVRCPGWDEDRAWRMTATAALPLPPERWEAPWPPTEVTYRVESSTGRPASDPGLSTVKWYDGRETRSAAVTSYPWETTLPWWGGAKGVSADWLDGEATVTILINGLVRSKRAHVFSPAGEPRAENGYFALGTVVDYPNGGYQGSLSYPDRRYQVGTFWLWGTQESMSIGDFGSRLPFRGLVSYQKESGPAVFDISVDRLDLTLFHHETSRADSLTLNAR
jgi:hypothetical protein